MLDLIIADVGLFTPVTFGEDEYRELCELIQLPPVPDGYGVALVITEDDSRLTAVTPLGLAGGETMYARGWMPLPRPRDPLAPE